MIEKGIIPSICIISAFLIGTLFGCTEGYKTTKKEILIEKCEQTNGRYDFCEKKIEKKEYFVIKGDK